MDRQPVLEGERLLLRPLTENDRSAFVAAAGDPLIWEQHPDANRWRDLECNAWFDGALAEAGALAVIEKEKGQLVGSSRFQTLDFGPEAAVIGSTFLVRRLWGSGANREMKRLMVAHALAFRPRAWFLIGEHNWRSRKAMEAIGGRLTEETYTMQIGSGPALHVVFEITRADFANGPLASA
jgi:RimJ/RimL family protein N-acetyltransferase